MTTPPTVLVADDDARNRALVRAMLAHEYRVIEAEDGPGALAALDREGADLVLLDVMMPGLDGVAACRAIKAKAGDEFLPVLLLTALASQENRNAGLEAGADDYLTKPVDRHELLLRVRLFLRIREHERTIRRQVEEIHRLEALREDIVSLMVHDLRNPLSGVVGFLQALSGEISEPTQREDVAMALASARKLQETLDDMLDARRIEDGHLTLRREPWFVRELCTDSAATVAGSAKDRAVRIEVRCDTDAVVSLDRKLVRRAVENLLANALKYSPRGDTILVAARETGGAVEVEVADRGPGIPDALKSELFTRFGSVEAKRGEARRGFGLGLYLVRLVAEAHGGTASVHDREDGGTIFRLRLPAAATEAGA